MVSSPLISDSVGIYQGQYQNLNLPWLRWWDAQGKLLLAGEERANRLTAKADRAWSGSRSRGMGDAIALQRA